MTVPDTKESSRSGDSWWTPKRFSALLAALIFLAFPDVLLGWKTFFHHDYGIFGYPLAFYHRESFWRGEVPLWNPLNFCGIPFLAQWNTMVFYPGTLIYLLLPMPWSLGVFSLAHLFLAGLGAYFLARHWTQNSLAASVAGIAFTFNGLALHCLNWPSNMATYALMPWVVWTVERALHHGKRDFVLAAVVGALQMLTGSPETIAFTWLIAAGIFLIHGIERAGDLRRMTLYGISLIFLVTALSAVELLPFLELLRNSHRDSAYADVSYSMPATGWANFLVPLFHCHESRYGVFFQADQHWTSSYYLGVVTLALAVAALASIRHPRVWLLGAIGFAGMVLALGEHGFIYPILRAVLPQLGFMNFPVKFVALTVFAVPFLAAFGLTALLEKPLIIRKRFNTILLVFIAAIIALLIYGRINPASGEDLRLTLITGTTRILFLITAFALAIFLPRFSEMKKRHLAELGILTLLAFDALTHAPRQNPTIDSSAFHPNLIRQRPAALPVWPEARAWIDPQIQEKLSYSKISDGYAHFLGFRALLFKDCNLLDHVPKVDGFFPLHLRDFESVATLLNGSVETRAQPLLNFLGVSHVPDPENFMEWKKREQFFPLVTGGQKPLFVNEKETLAGLFHPTFNSQQIVFLPSEAQSSIHVKNPTTVKIEKRSFSAQKIELHVSAAEPSLVVLAQTFYPAWKSFIDGQPVPIWRANQAFQAIEIPAGDHDVKFVYKDNHFFIGGVISLAACVLCVLLWLKK